MRKILTILTLLIQLFVSSLTAQNNYPIYVSPTLMPPYTLKLSDYSAMGSQKLMVTVVVNDLDVANLPVKLRLKMETAGVTIENPPTLTTTPIYLDGGSTTLLFGQDLIDNFNINKLLFKGYSKKAYRSSGQLPEGFYRFTVEVLHFHTNKVISNQGTISAWITIGEPPLLQSPRNDGQLGQYIGMPVTFSWLSSKVGSPMAAGNIQYKLEMWEMRTPGVSPYTVAASIPVFHEYSTHSTFYSFDPASLMLEPGIKYAWRVTASDVGGLVSFEQDRESEIRTFTYKALCDSVTELKAISTGKKGSFSWTPGSNHTSYNVEVRNQTSGWFSASESFNSKVDFYDLTPSQTYQLRVQSVCNSDPSSVSDFTQWTSLTVSEQESLINEEECPDCACDDNIPEVTLSNFDLRQNLSPGDTLSNKTGTTRFIVRSVEPQGNSTYKGIFYFWAEIWDLKVPCEYWDLQVNTDNVIVNMDYESVYDPSLFFDLDSITNLVNNVLDNAAVLTSDASIKDTIVVDQEYESVFVNAQGELVGVSVDENGNVTEQPLGVSVDETDKTLVQNKDGEEVVVTRNGDVMGVEEYKNTGGGNNRMLRNHNKEKEENNLASSGMVDFSPASNQNFGFDTYSDLKTAIQNDYPALNNQYRPPFKSVRSYGTDKVTVSNIEGLTFKDEMGIPAPVSGNQITIRGSSPGMSRALYAYRQNNEEEEIAGKLNILSYDERPKRVYIVPVNDAQLPDEVTLQNTLNRIYKQAVTSWTVLEKPGISVSFPGGTMTHGGSGVGTYNADQRAIVNQYTQSHKQLEQDAFYLFFVENVQNKGKAIAGYMPLQRQVGFIYGKPNDITIAHELAHGAFNLRHPFSDHQFIAPEGTTHNLMDYDSPKGEELWKYQWDYIHDPETMLFSFLQDEEEGAMVVENSTRAFARLIKTINCAHNSGKKEVKLYLPTSTITASVSSLVSELYLAGNPCTEDAEVKATLYEMFGEVVDLSNDYLEDVFSLEDIGYDESNKIITLKGSKYKLLINGEKDALCAYNFAKNNLFGSLHVPKTPVNFASLDDLQYSSPCELQYLSIDSRKNLLQKIQSETNWYNGSLKDSRQKITINIIATTPKKDRGSLISFFSSNKALLKTLFDRIDDYRGEFIEELNNVYQDGLGSLSGNKVVALGLQPGVMEQDMPWYEDLSFMWGYLYTIKKHTYAEYVSADKISVYIKEYRGISIGREALMADGQLLCEGSPFDVIKGVKLESGKQVDIPLFYFLYKAEEGETDAMYKDISALGEKSVDLALIVFGLKNLQGASSLLKAEVTAQNVARLLLGFGDLTTLGLGEICENGTSEFCQAYKEYEFYINMGLLSANILNEFPQLYKSLKKGLDDPALSETQKNGLKKVLGETEDILSQRQDFWTNYKSKYFPDGDWGKTEFVTEGLDYNTFKNSNPAIYNEMAAKYGSSEIAEEYLPGLIESGSSIPTKVILNKGDELYKIVPSGSDISGLSPYYLSKAELNFVKQNPEKLEQVLGLPLSSCSGKYEVYKIVAKENNLAVFEANIAPTKQYLKSNPSDFYSTTGGRKQTLLIDNGDTDLWEKSSSAIETIEPTVLPVIE